MTQLAINERAPSSAGQSIMNFGTFDEAMRWADLIAKSDLCPKDCRGKPGDVLIRIEFGKRLGLSPMQALCNIATINGKPSMYGDVLMGLCRSSPICETIRETFDEEKMTATCTVKRRGEEAQSRSFSLQDAKLAGLWGRPGPWSQYPKRMLQMRARAWALRDVFADLLGGISFAEEAQDIPVAMTPVESSPNVVFLEERKRESTATAILRRLQLKQEGLSQPEIIIDEEPPEVINEEPEELSKEEVSVEQDNLEKPQKVSMKEKTYNTLCRIICKYAVPSERVDKWLERAQVSTLEELSEEQAVAIITMLEKQNS